VRNDPSSYLFEFFSSTYRARHDAMDGAAVHDPLAVMVLTHPELFRRVTRHVDVETSGRLTRGMTVIDQRTLVERPEGHCDVVVDVDVDGAWSEVTRAVEAFSR
jgi:inosine-uridine nucleoside N-ribohydrolase